jgi:hypothetical protein
VTSCVPTKDLIYLQDKDDTQVNEVVSQVVQNRTDFRQMMDFITIKALIEISGYVSPSESSLNTK